MTVQERVVGDLGDDETQGEGGHGNLAGARQRTTERAHANSVFVTGLGDARLIGPATTAVSIVQFTV